MARYCFQLEVAPEHLPEYLARHREVWAEMRIALVDTGWQNYSLFARPDGLIIGYVEADCSFAELQERMKEHAINARWQAEMAPLMSVNGEAQLADLVMLDEAFHLDDPRTTEGKS